jgi:hypothetical protein
MAPLPPVLWSDTGAARARRSPVPQLAPVQPARSPGLQREALKDALLATVNLLELRRCAEIAEGYIDGYVALNWMEWNGGSLRLTVTGSNIRKQLTAGLV